jgi:hypothetical protein
LAATRRFATTDGRAVIADIVDRVIGRAHFIFYVGDQAAATAF